MRPFQALLLIEECTKSFVSIKQNNQLGVINSPFTTQCFDCLGVFVATNKNYNLKMTF